MPSLFPPPAAPILICMQVLNHEGVPTLTIQQVLEFQERGHEFAFHGK
jgi:hypothetical protein